MSPKIVVVDARLGEWNAGKEFELRPLSDFFALCNKSVDRYQFKTSDGESYVDVLRRTGEFFYDIEKKYTGKNILVVTHGAIARGLLWITEGFSYNNLSGDLIDLGFQNAEIRELDFVPLPHNENYELDLHRPYIDDVILVDKNGKSLKRVPEIFDTWYDSGSMPFAQEHYPFENKKEFEEKNSPLFPADFIAEGLDQTRGWFYTLLVLSVGLFDRSPYERVLVNGLVLAEDGRKMSKSLNNYPDLMDIVNKYGADALRYYLMSSPLVKAEDFNFSEKGVDEIYKKLIQKIYNVLAFYELYLVEGKRIPKETILDTWILSRLSELTKKITISLDKYELDRASRPIMDFVDDLSTWYIRRSRDRFKSDDKDVSFTASYYTRFALREFSKVIAPFMPFIAEEVYRRTEGELESVHLENWPDTKTVNEELVLSMQKVREVVSSALELRQKAGYKVRQPLAKLKVKSLKLKEELSDLIKDEVNVKEIVFDENMEGDFELDTNLTDELLEEGKLREVVRAIQDWRKENNWKPGEIKQYKVPKAEEDFFEKHREKIQNATNVELVK